MTARPNGRLADRRQSIAVLQEVSAYLRREAETIGLSSAVLTSIDLTSALLEQELDGIDPPVTPQRPTS